MKLVNDSPGDSLLVVAAEASSCMYAKLFIQQWKSLNPKDTFYGIGDKQMENQGMNCLGLAEDLGVVGLMEVAKHWPVIKNSFESIIAEVERNPPRFALLLDYPGFNLRLAKKLHKMGIPVVYYISPQLWAWKKGRVKQVKKYVDDMMVVFPFEVDFYKGYGIEAQFVGHPLVEVVELETGDQRGAPDKANSIPVLGLMPGSRKSEISYNLTEQLKAAEIIQKRIPIRLKILLAPTLTRQDLEPLVQNFDLDIEYIQRAPTSMIMDCDYILTASGTATLQVALCGKPMVVMYRMNPITAFLAKRLVNTVDSFCIVNLIAGKKVVPELFQEQAIGKNLASHIVELIENSERRDQMKKDLVEVKDKLGKGGATENLVKILSQKYGGDS